jgi:hypothetical protein
MTSKAYNRWWNERLAELNELLEAHEALEGGGASGRRYRTLRVNHAYAVILSGASKASAEICTPSASITSSRNSRAERSR